MISALCSSISDLFNYIWINGLGPIESEWAWYDPAAYFLTPAVLEEAPLLYAVLPELIEILLLPVVEYEVVFIGESTLRALFMPTETEKLFVVFI